MKRAIIVIASLFVACTTGSLLAWLWINREPDRQKVEPHQAMDAWEKASDRLWWYIKDEEGTWKLEGSNLANNPDAVATYQIISPGKLATLPSHPTGFGLRLIGRTPALVEIADLKSLQLLELDDLFSLDLKQARNLKFDGVADPA